MLARRTWRSLLLPGIVFAFVCGNLPVSKADDPPTTTRKVSAVEPDEVDKSTELIFDDDAVEEDKSGRSVEQAKYGGRAEKARRRAAKKQSEEDGESSTPPRKKPVRQAPASSDGDVLGMIGQGGHLAFKTFGRNDSISPIEAMPFALTGQHFFFSDLRGFMSNNTMFGGNMGLGYRNLQDELNSWFGGSLWYDVDGTTGRTYEQIGVSLEAMVQQWELRSNLYLPLTNSISGGSYAFNPSIVGNQLLYSQYVGQTKALTGFDVEAGYNIPVLEPYRLRAFAGYYRFDGGPSGSINGFKARLEGVINNSVTANVMYTTDPLFGSNIMLGCQIQFPWGANHPTSTWGRSTPSPFRFVERNYNVIVDGVGTITNNLAAINPQTNTPYSIEQVSSSAGAGGNGTAAHPFSTISAAQSAGNVILVQGNSVFNTPVTLATGQFLVGDGSTQPLPLPGGESIVLPTVIPGSKAPEFTNITGDAVTLASNSMVAGFNFSNVSGNGVVGSGITNAIVSDNVFQSIGGDAIHLTNSTGNFVLNDNTINTTTGSGLLMDSVDGNVTVTSLSTTKTTGTAVSITAGNSGSSYHFAGTTNIQQPNGVGFSLNGSAAKVAVDNLVVNSTSTSGAVSLTNSTAPITISNLDINMTKGSGLTANTLGLLSISNGSITTIGAPALNLQTTTLGVNLGQVSTNGGTYGVSLVQDLGSFTVSGANAFGTGGTIQNTTTAVILNSAGSVNLNWMNLASNGTGIQSNGNSSLRMYGLQITNSTGYAVDSLDDLSVSVLNSQFSGNGTLGGGTIRLQTDKVATYTWLAQGNTIIDATGTPISMSSEAAGAGATLTATVLENTITGYAANTSLVNINWNGPMTAVVSTNSLSAATANGMTGVSVQDSSTTTSSVTQSINVEGNVINFAGDQGTGVMVAAAGSNTISVTSNTVAFGGTGGIGLHFNLTGPGTTIINANTVRDNAGGATGILFDTVAAGSSIQMNSNTITLLASDTTVHRGIIFTAVSPTITLGSATNNVVTNASQVFYIPASTFVGYIAVNSQEN